MVSLNWLGIIIIAMGIFVIGNFWFGPLFGKTWMRIHHGSDRMSESEMKKAMKGMWKLMLTEFIATFIMVMTLEFLIQILPSYSGMHIAFMIWLGFILPMTASNGIWGSDKKEWMCKKIAIASGYRLMALVAAGYILSIW